MSATSSSFDFTGQKSPNSATALESAFRVRGAKYAAAGLRFPHIRKYERKKLIDLLSVRKGDLIVDLQAAAGYLSDGIKDIWGDEVGTICVEPSALLRSSIDSQKHLVLPDPLETLSLPDCFVTKVGCLAGTHHAPKPALLFCEALRVLRRGGIFAVADVRLGSPIDEWLNVFVDSQLPEGHSGTFFEFGTFSALLAASGFVDINESVEVVTWDFESLYEGVVYCKTLFGLCNSSNESIEMAILSILPHEFLSSGQFRINWELIYAVGSKK
jgi:SAM-dependent methyltransferase